MSVSMVKVIEPCTVCQERTSSPTMGRWGSIVGKICPDCVYWYDGNVIPEDPPHTGHFSRLGGTWWCDTCNSPYCELA